MKYFDEFYDIAILEVDTNKKNINICKLNLKPKLNYGDLVAFGGFSNQHGYSNDKFPFSYNEGIISSFPTTIVGGGSYEHIRINSINLGGNSGAPLFIKGTKDVIGIINGNMNWGSDNMVFEKIDGSRFKDSFRVPLNIAYSTLIKLLKDKTGILNL